MWAQSEGYVLKLCKLKSGFLQSNEVWTGMDIAQEDFTANMT